MAKNIRRMFAMVLVMCMILSALPMQALAAEGDGVVTETVDGIDITTTTTTITSTENDQNTIVVTVEKVSEGTKESTGEQVSASEQTTTTTVTDNNAQLIESSSSTESDSTIISTDAEGNTVTVQTEQITESADSANGDTYDFEQTQTTTTVVSENGTETTLEVEEGSETTVEVVPTDDEINVDVIVDGEVQEDASGSSNTAGTTVTGDLKEENPDNYDQTTVTTTDKTVDVTVENIEISTGTPVYVDDEGHIVGKTDDGFNYYWSDIYTVDGKSIIDGEVSQNLWTTGRVIGYIVNADGTKTEVHREGTCQRVVAHDNGTPEDPSDDYEVGGLYCVDASTGIKQYLKYRRANLEDASYYDENDIAHLRGIMTYGYTWDDDDDNGYTNLDAMKTMLKDAQENGDEATKALLQDIDFSTLTREQAATATGMAVWTYGNRYVLEDGQRVEYVTRNETAENARKIETLYKYLMTLTKEAPEETQIINEEKFIENLDMTVGGMAEGNAANTDNDSTNDVYNVALKFSLVVEPSKENDDLVVKVVDGNGNVVRTARIAGEKKENEDFDYAKTEVDENGKTYYVLEDLELAENANTSFNLKLEGTQLLKEGIYIFESQQLSQEETIDQLVQLMEQSGELEDMLKEYGTMDAVREAIAKNYSADIHESQNFIGKYEGTAEIDVSMQIDLTFNVEESVVTTERIWHVEKDPTAVPPQYDRDTPVYDEPAPVAMMFRLNNQDNLEEIPEEPVPLAAPAITGDNSGLWVAVILLSLFCMVAVNVFDKKRQHEAF